MSEYEDKNFFIDPGIIKQEPIMSDSTVNISASVPIPPRRDFDYRDYGLEFETSESPLYTDIGIVGQMQNQTMYESNSWGLSKLLGTNLDQDLKTEPFIHMDEDDIFQVDKADLIQGPTLAELNANDENLLDDLNFDDLLLPEEGTYTNLEKKVSPLHPSGINNLNNNCLSPCLPQNYYYQKDLDSPSGMNAGSYDYFKYKHSLTSAAFSPGSQNSSNSSIVQIASSPLNISDMQQKHSTLHELLVQGEIYRPPAQDNLGQSFPERNSEVRRNNMRMTRFHNSRLSSSAPTHLGMEQIWQRREPRKHLLSTSSLAEAGSTSSLSTGGLLSPDPPDLSVDEDSEDESDGHYEDFSSDNDSDDDDDRSGRHSGGSKKDRYFWQYNVQAKGPKGQRLVMKSKMEDPHYLNEVTDPVFSPDCSVRGIKHSGKARKGDGNDLTPNPRKLHNIGRELEKLGRIINDMTPVSELPFTVRPTSRKEKNKLASRACRLKKKAQHEANKIKLTGLEVEHKRLINGIVQAKRILAAKLAEKCPENQEALTLNMEKVIQKVTRIKIAGLTTEYVNKVLEKFNTGENALTLPFAEEL